MRIDRYMAPAEAAAWWKEQSRIEQEAQWERHRERMKRSKEEARKEGEYGRVSED
jgi:hypothetical protein